MAGFHLRFVGSKELPKSLSDFDVEQSFKLSSGDIAAIRERFRTDRRLGAAVQLVVLRATGRVLDRATYLPRTLLKSLCHSLGLSETAIGSLKTIYKRVATLYDHQKWARETAGTSDVDDAAMAELTITLAELTKTAASVDDLVQAAERWLFDRRYLLPSDRVLRDLARESFASTEALAMAGIKKEIPAPVRKNMVSAVFSPRRGRAGGTMLEWLKTPPGKHSPTTLTEVSEKITYLKTLEVDKWPLSHISTARMRAYAQAVANRPPFDTRRLSDDTQMLEVTCFLRVTLLDLTDTLMYLTGRRINDLHRHASGRVLSKQARTAVEYRQQRDEMRLIIHAEGTTSDEKIEALKKLIPNDESVAPIGHAALVRQSLIDDTTKVTSLLNVFADLEIKGDAAQRPLKQVMALRELDAKGMKELPADFDVSIVDPVWHEMLNDKDRSKAFAALKAATMQSVRHGFRSSRLWIDHSWDYRNREDLLIPPAQWKKDRLRLISALSLNADPEKFLTRLYAHLEAGLQALSEAVEAGEVSIDESGLVHLPQIEALAQDKAIDASRNMMFASIGEVQIGDIIVEMDAATGFSEVLLGRRAKTTQELVSCYAALLAHGTENDAKGVAAMIPGVEVAHISAAMRSLEAHGRLRRANDRVVEFQRQHSITANWGSGTKASSDMMALDASRHLYNSRTDPRRRTRAIGLYTHVLDVYGVAHDEPIVHNERQGSVAVSGVEEYNAAQSDENMRLSKLAVDTHGYTFVAMTMSKLLGFDLCPQMRDLAERRLYLPRSVKLPENLERIALTNVSERAIHKGWDELLRLIASIRSGRLTPKEALEKMGSSAQGDPLHKAADQMGRLLRTLFLCDYFSNPEFRREMHTLLNRGESVHQLQRAIYFGRLAAERGRRRDEIRAVSGSHALLTNLVIAWNTMKMQHVVDRWRKEKHPIEDAWLRRMGPVHFGHINFRGLMAFGVERYADALLDRPPQKRRASGGA